MMANGNFVLHEDEEASGRPTTMDLSNSDIEPVKQLSALETSSSANLNGSDFKAELLPKKHPRSHRRHIRIVDAFIEQDKDIASFHGFHAPMWKTILYYAIAILTCGVSLLVGHWAPRVRIFLSLARCNLATARYVRIVLVDGHVDIEEVHTVDNKPTDAPSMPPSPVEEGRENLLQWQASTVFKLLEYRCNRYFYVDTLDTFVPVPGLPKGFSEQLQRAATQLAAGGNDPVAAADHGDWDVADRQMRYGKNEMRVPVKSIGLIIFEEMWHPFYVFQYFSILIWVVGDAYYYYSACIFCITWFSIISEAVEMHRNRKRLADIAHYSTDVEVVRNGMVVKVLSSALVPGDVLLVTTGVLPCDAVLLAGECIVDENMLTGECVPVRKVCYSPVADGLNYHPDKTPACTLYGGTMVAQARAPRHQRVVAVVCRTRFYSAKGELLRSILFPREHQQSFVSDSLKFIVIMLTACMLMYVWAAIVLAKNGASASRIIVRMFDMITIAVPPALPACLTIATVISVNRLRKKDIFVTSPDRITVAGLLDVICFDKTGTLTEQGLDLQGVVSITQEHIYPMATSMEHLPPRTVALLASCHGLARLGEQLVGDPLDQKLFLATQWKLLDAHAEDPSGRSRGTTPRNSGGGKDPNGDGGGTTRVLPPGAHPATGSHIVLRRFEFSAALQRNAVVVHSPQGETSVFVKGSPEMLRTLVVPNSIPQGFDAVLGEYVQQGLRVLALAAGDASEVPEHALMQWTQQEMESHVPLYLVGLAVMVNPLRADTTGVIQCLQTAGIRTAMVTGDHLRTGISIGYQCTIVPPGRPICLVDGQARPGPSHLEAASTPMGLVFPVQSDPEAISEAQLSLSLLHPDGSSTPWTMGRQAAAARIMAGEFECALTGKGFDRLLGSLDTVLLPACLHRACVFARMSPDNKRDLVQLIGNGIDGLEGSPKLGLFCGFCGDGANDCGALKAAHVGVSLCEAEASVAAPMTSRNQTIASMVTVVAEGRCTLMATYQIFQFIIGYALVQAFEANMMYMYALNIGDYQYLIEDLFFTTVLAAFMGFTRPRTVLSRQKPLPRVLSLPLAIGTLAQLLVVVLFQLAPLWALQRQAGYVRTKGAPDLRQVVSPENTSTYIVAMAQFIVLALVFNKGHPHRSPLYTNWALSIALVFQVGWVLYSLISTDWFNREVQELVGNDTVVDGHFRKILFMIIVWNALAAFAAMFLMEAVITGVNGFRCRRIARREAAANAVALAAAPAPSAQADLELAATRGHT